jgi:glucan 1,3-beta-glucosidase
MAEQISELSREERAHYHTTLANAQLAAWEGTEGWFFWNYKLLADGAALDGWDLGKSIELGYFPAN